MTTTTNKPPESVEGILDYARTNLAEQTAIFDAAEHRGDLNAMKIAHGRIVLYRRTIQRLADAVSPQRITLVTDADGRITSNRSTIQGQSLEIEAARREADTAGEQDESELLYALRDHLSPDATKGLSDAIKAHLVGASIGDLDNGARRQLGWLAMVIDGILAG